MFHFYGGSCESFPGVVHLSCGVSPSPQPGPRGWRHTGNSVGTKMFGWSLLHVLTLSSLIMQRSRYAPWLACLYCACAHTHIYRTFNIVLSGMILALARDDDFLSISDLYMTSTSGMIAKTRHRGKYAAVLCSEASLITEHFGPWLAGIVCCYLLVTCLPVKGIFLI